MEPLRRVAVGVNAGVIRSELLHLIEAVFDGVGLGLVTQVPLAREVGRIAVLLEELRNRGGLFAQSILIAGGDHN